MEISTFQGIKANHIKLKNGIQTLHMNQNNNKFAMAISVNCGSFNDKDEFYGMAHFLEHILFMGTEKYPKEDDFTEFLSKTNGSYNGITYYDQTIYFLECDKEYAAEAIDRLADFFKNPLFYEKSIENEIRAVDSEFKNNFNYDDTRIDRIYCDLNDKNSPINRFTTGNLKTLSLENKREKMIQFFKDNYKNFNIAIYSDMEEKKLTDLLNLTFGEILISNTFKIFNRSNKNLDFKKTISPHFIEFKSLSENKTMSLLIQLPSEYKIEYNQYNYIGDLLIAKNPQSLQYMLIQKKLILEINHSFENTEYFSILKIDFLLTEKGFKNYNMILKLFSEYNFYHELKYERLLEIKYRNYEIQDIGWFVEEMAHKMNYITIKDIFEHERNFTIDFKFFYAIIKILQDSKNWVVFINSCEEKNYAHKEKYYGFEYNLLQPVHFSNSNPLSELHKTVDFTIERNNICMNFINSNLNMNISELYLNFEGNYEKILNLIIYFESKIELFFIENDFYRELNCVEISYEIMKNNFILIFKSLKIIETLILFFNTEIKEDYFNIAINKKRSDLLEFDSLNVFKQLNYKIDETMNFKKNTKDLLEELNEIIFMDIKNLKIHFNYLNCIFVGRVEKEEILKTILLIENSFHQKNMEFLPINLQSLTDQYDFKLKKSNKNKCVNLLFLNDSIDLKQYVSLLLIQNILGEMFFDDLRTKQQFGYVVRSDLKISYRLIGLFFLVQSERSLVDIKKGIEDFVHEIHAKINSVDLKIYKKSLHNFINENRQSVSSSCDFYIPFVKLGFSLENIKEKLMHNINLIEKSDLKIYGKKITFSLSK